MPFNMQQNNGPSAARRVLFAALLVVSLALVTVYGREGQDGALHAVQSSVMGVTGQATRVGAGLGAAADSAASAVGDATADATTLSALREQNAELRELLANAEEYRQEVDRLRGLLDIKQVSGVSGPVAHVVGRSLNAWDQSITIDLGSEDGVVSGMTVMGSTGVIGQVSRAAEHTSSVRLLTDPNSGAAVMVQSSRANGIVRGSLSGLLYLEDIAEEDRPVEGDVILTSGLGGSYERGLIVGAVVSVSDTATGTGDIIINPNATAKMLEEVIVVFKAPTIATSSASAGSASGAAADASNSQIGLDGQVESADVVYTPQETQTGVIEDSEYTDELDGEDGEDGEYDEGAFVDEDGDGYPDE